MRIGELLNTPLADINLTEKRIEIFETQKNRVARVVFIRLRTPAGRFSAGSRSGPGKRL